MQLALSNWPEILKHSPRCLLQCCISASSKLYQKQAELPAFPFSPSLEWGNNLSHHHQVHKGGWIKSTNRVWCILSKMVACKEKVQVLSECKWSQVVLAKIESWSSFLEMKSHDSLEGLTFINLASWQSHLPAAKSRMRQKVWRLCLTCCQWWLSFPGEWPKQLQEDIHRTFCGPAELHEDFAIRVGRKDAKPVQSLCPKGFIMVLVVWTQMLWSFLDPALLRHLGIVMLRDTGQFFECRSSAHFFLFRGKNDGDCPWLPMTDKRLKCSSSK